MAAAHGAARPRLQRRARNVEPRSCASSVPGPVSLPGQLSVSAPGVRSIRLRIPMAQPEK